MENKLTKTYTKGNVIVEDIKVGDVHYEFEYGMCIKCEVITLPVLNEKSQYEWKSKNLSNGRVIDYLVDPEFSHYSANLYDYEAYKVKTYL
jgi:hypothetical protein